ncbi:LADA_0H11386g1_1 [Lachancea dasiensis]|uniref:LADA_0H11386g1_1 n=1 Tax=Lachancea dasiensis TaxID=1072105 RepID=A0A1G4K3G1_9SACH|nr:LADA_0H11386g1_1 [Lachancea dasiensis]
MIHQMAPWVPQFIQSWKNHSQTFTPFSFATVDPITNRPKCRTVIFRDFLFHDKRSNVLTFTTDMRGDKVKEILASGSETAPFEACFYFPSTWEQYRFSGKCFVVSQQQTPPISSKYNLPDAGTIEYPILSPSVHGGAQELYKYDEGQQQQLKGHGEAGDEEEEQEDSEGSAAACQAEGGSVPASGSQPADLSRSSTSSSRGGGAPAHPNRVLGSPDYAPPLAKEWQLELTRQWFNLSRSTKAQFRKPDPGTPVTSETSKQLDKIQRGVDGAKEDAGFDNFGVVCLCIEEVDFLNLKDGRGGERWKFRRHVDPDTGAESWNEEEVCP